MTKSGSFVLLCCALFVFFRVSILSVFLICLLSCIFQREPTWMALCSLIVLMCHYKSTHSSLLHTVLLLIVFRKLSSTVKWWLWVKVSMKYSEIWQCMMAVWDVGMTLMIIGRCAGIITLMISDWCAGILKLELCDHTATITSLSFARHPSVLLVSASMDGTLKLWDMSDDGNMIKTLRTNCTAFYGCCWSPDSTSLATVGNYHSVNIASSLCYCIGFF